MIRILDLSKSYGEQKLFDGVNLTIGEKEKIGLIGRNGSGKSTFLRLLLGHESYDSGTIEIPEKFRMETLEQNLEFTEKTILAQVSTALGGDAGSEEWRVKSMLMGLGFSESDFERPPEEFSSGLQVRIRLAQALIRESHLLLLDEPTNYLDILSLRWMERFLRSWKGAFILVTHDQNFMNEVVDDVVGIHRGKMRKMSGTPKKLLDQIAKEEEVYEKTRLNREKKQAKTMVFIREFRAGARSAGLVQSRIKALEKQKAFEKLPAIPKISFQFKLKKFTGDRFIKANNLQFGYPEKKDLIHRFSMTVYPGDRIAIIGRNGKGKTTLLKLLAEKLSPDEGHISKGENVRTGYFGSDSKDALNEQNTILAELLTIPQTTETRVRTLAGALLFSGNTVKKQISLLSGGEKSRVGLAKVMLAESNVLMLDEPTNHLDMESCEELLRSLQTYEGTVIFVTHDENILSELATRLVVFDDGKITVKEQTYREFLDSGGWTEEDDFNYSRYKSDSNNKMRYLEKKKREGELRRNQTKQKNLEKTLLDLETDQKKTAESLHSAYEHKDQEQMKTFGIRLKEIGEAIERGYEELERLLKEEEEMKNGAKEGEA